LPARPETAILNA